MKNNIPEIVDFIFNIRMIRYPDGEEDYQTRIENGGISKEITIMQIKSYLRVLEDDYFENFKNNSAMFKQE